MVIQKKLYTVEEFEKFIAQPDNADRRFELIEGEIFEKMPTEEHGLAVSNMVIALGAHVKQHKLGRVVVEVRHGLPGDKFNDRIPDISFTSDISRPLVKKGAVPRMPDLAVEVKSPDDEFQDLRKKADYYLKHGCRLVWLVYPDSRTVEVCTLGPDGKVQRRTLTNEQRLDGEDVIPGFQMLVSDIFAE
jgi:Uma2 family endonuclease